MLEQDAALSADGRPIAREQHGGPDQAFSRATYRDGCRHQAEGRLRDAAKCFAAAVAEAPGFTDASQNLGCSLFALGRFAEAADVYAEVVRARPVDAGSRYNLGMALLSAGKHLDAVAALRFAVELDGRQARHHRALGEALVAAGRKAEAAAALMAGARLAPPDAGTLACLAGVLTDLGNTEAAAGAAFLAVQRDPELFAAQGNLARALHSLGRSRDAVAPARAAVRLGPQNPGAVAMLGAALHGAGLHAESLAWSQRALALSPGMAQAEANAALALEALGRLEEAEAVGRAALARAPDDPVIQHNLAAMLLASGRMDAESWALYEGRLRLNPAAAALAGLRRWRGEAVEGRKVLLHCEQGFGDTIQFARYAALVAEKGAEVTLAVQPELLRLLQGLPGTHVVAAGTTIPRYDVFCPLLSAPAACGTTLETIPAPGRYITPDPALVRQWALPPAAGLQVGLTWAGNAGFIHDADRSIAPGKLAILAGVPGVRFHSLQKPAQAGAACPMLDRMAQAGDFADTAAIIAGLDLVISIDSAVAHLAAAMGKEVWLLSRFVGCWRWLRNRDDSPWYPTVRIYRQARSDDWDSVLDRVRADLAERATVQ